MEPGREGSPLVLVCDDTEPIRRLIRVNLELDGFEVVEACEGGEALAYLRDPANRLPDVVTLDATMEPHGGWWAIREIRDDRRLHGIPVVMVTASTQVHDRAQASAAGFDAFVSKPFEPGELMAIIERLATAPGHPPEQP